MSVTSKQMNIGTYIEQYHSAPDVETRVTTSGFKITPTQKLALKGIAKKTGKKVTDLHSEALDLYFQYIDHVASLSKNEDVIIPLLKRL